MATLTTNLFHGHGPGDHRLDVVEGHWPDDMLGDVYVVGPDKRRPGGHWFGERGLVMRISCRTDSTGRIPVRSRVVRTPVLRIRDRMPWMFRKIAFADVSPLGSTNLANTNIEPINGRLFVGYDAGRQVEIDPETLKYLTPVGANDEWLQALPGVLEPMIAVAAHPAADEHDGVMWFVNYTPIPSFDGSPTVYLARWDMTGPIERWPLTGLPAFDTFHDIKASSDHLVFSDLPFAAAETLSGQPRTPNSDVTQLFIVAKELVRSTPAGQPIPVTAIEIPMPTGHLMVDVDEQDGRLRVFLEHIPLSDLMIMLTGGEPAHGGGVIPADYEGLVTLAVQPGVVGRYLIDPGTGEVVESDIAWDDRFWGPILATRDRSTVDARARGGRLWFGGAGFDPELIPEEWWRLYGDGALNHVVDPSDLPTESVPGALATFDLDAMKVTSVHQFDDGAFPSPPQFVPRVNADGPDDGYVVAMVHRDGPKELVVFDASHIEHGPLARATAADFCPPLLLHSTWLGPDRPVRPDYRIPLRRDLRSATGQIPAQLRAMWRSGKAMAMEKRKAAKF